MKVCVCVRGGGGGRDGGWDLPSRPDIPQNYNNLLEMWSPASIDRAYLTITPEELPLNLSLWLSPLHSPPISTLPSTQMNFYVPSSIFMDGV